MVLKKEDLLTVQNHSFSGLFVFKIRVNSTFYVFILTEERIVRHSLYR